MSLAGAILPGVLGCNSLLGFDKDYHEVPAEDVDASGDAAADSASDAPADAQGCRQENAVCSAQGDCCPTVTCHAAPVVAFGGACLSGPCAGPGSGCLDTGNCCFGLQCLRVSDSGTARVCCAHLLDAGTCS